jgi:hypothetical protein
VTLEEKVAFLLERDREAQRGHQAVTDRVGALEAKTPEQLEELRERMEAHVTRELTTALEDYRPLRVSGAVLLALGLSCVTVANFIL